ncbi:MAG: hypothetical protein COX30_04530 [Candidatus Moranbacteria bacterium CG23_combo_of_CG06-09_8_20_14_all_39_10]|nr:MAG: hypothetical protein COX30_04530 [Candidatus Moranbacteria bacterium CG23_combo_of_CG06-09_8_20_14_all_39_10]
MPDEQQHAENLNAARKGSFKNSAANAKKNIKAAANFSSLIAQLDPFMDWLFGIALIFAIIKDILDLINTALITAGGVGWVLIVVFTFIVSLIIAFTLLLTGSSGKRGLAKKIALLISASLVESLPAIGLLPIESIIVIILFWLTLKERKAAAQEKAQQEQS